jgi:hypothetical protein
MPDLVIFISHKLQSRDRATEIAGALSAFGGSRIRVYYSGRYTAGIDWREKIQNDLTEASWLILLYEGPHVAWDWCLFETGFFSAKMKDSKTDPRLICLHNPEYNVPGPMDNFNSLPASEARLTEFFRQIYVDEPWKISPNLFQENGKLVISTVGRIVSAVVGTPRSRLYFAAPSFAIHVKVDQIEILKDGQIPPEAYLSGDGGWETMFGKPAHTVSWLWRDIVKGLESPEPWIYPLATIMWQAYDFQRVPYPSVGVRIKFTDEDVDEYRVFRLSLQKAEVTGDEVKFAFAAAAVVTPYEPANNPKETSLYHLYNLAWFFRRRLLERELPKLDAALMNRPRNENVVQKVIREISNDFRTMLADAQVRGVEQQAGIIQSFDGPLRDEVTRNLQELWPPLHDRLFNHLKVGLPAAELISETLHSMKPINHFFLKVSIEALSKHLDDK